MKPENILYISQPGDRYHFQLGDFGLCNRAVDAITFAGTKLYMAPEMFSSGRQTSKSDVWSLFVTLLWTLDFRGFRQSCSEFESPKAVQRAVQQAVSLVVSEVSGIREMAIFNPEQRASAAQMLVKCFKGEGLSTPQDRVPALTSSLSAAG